MTVAIINTKSKEAFILRKNNYYWGRNFAYAVEFDNFEQFAVQHPAEANSRKKFEAIDIPDDLDDQETLAENLGLVFAFQKRHKGDRINHKEYALPSDYKDRYYEREEVAKILGVNKSTLKKYSTNMPLIRLKRHGKFKDVYYTTVQLHSLFVRRLRFGKAGYDTMYELYDNWIQSITGAKKVLGEPIEQVEARIGRK